MGTKFALVCWFDVNVLTAIQVPVSKMSLMKCYQSTSVFFFFLSFSMGCVCVWGGITALSAQAAWFCVRAQASAVLLAQRFQHVTLISMLKPLFVGLLAL